MPSRLHLPALLVIMEGFGLAPTGPENAVSQAKLPYLRSLMALYPHTTLTPMGEGGGEAWGPREVGQLPAWGIGCGEGAQDPFAGLADALSQAHLRQLHGVETMGAERPASIVGAGAQASREGEELLLVESPDVASWDLRPEMAEAELTEAMARAIRADAADVYVVDYVNLDAVGHTGRVKAAVKAAEAVDDGISRIVPEVLAKGGFALITADHGNADHMFDTVAGVRRPHRGHTPSPVPLVVADPDARLAEGEGGSLTDVGATLLAMIGIPRPADLAGRSLVE